jgi:trk system potassium uptake protein TrkA
MNIIIVGAGEVGLHMAEKLSSQLRHDICVIEQSSSRSNELSERLDIRVLTANGTSVLVLEEANINECDLFMAVTSDQNTNLVAASLAKSLGAPKTIARVHGSMQREEWLFDFKKHFNIDYLFSSERLSAVELAKYVRSPDALFVEELARGQIEIQQITVSASSDAVGKPLRELDLPPRLLIGMVKREGKTHIPHGDFAVERGDLITMLGGPNRIKKARSIFHKDSSDGKQTGVIFGGNEYGAALAGMLEAAGMEVRVFEKDRKVCEGLAAILPEITILNADATALEILKEERVGDADFFVAVTPDDEDNVMSCLQAKGLGTRHCLTIIHRGDYARIVRSSRENLGLLGAVSPREATGRDLMRFVTADKYHLVRKLDGDTELIEVPVREKSRVCGKKVADAKFPPGAVLVAQVRGIQGHVPAAGDVLESGDTIYAIVAPEAKKEFIRLLQK